jgi:hypothetical protein
LRLVTFNVASVDGRIGGVDGTELAVLISRTTPAESRPDGSVFVRYAAR